jgi:transposase-like protein
MHGMPKKYDAATKERAVRMVQEQLPEYGGSLTKACSAVGARLGLPKDTVRGWCRREPESAAAGGALSTAEREEIKALKAKVRRLEEDNSILQAAATFFAGALDPRSR